jgi:hypothetical protein
VGSVRAGNGGLERIAGLLGGHCLRASAMPRYKHIELSPQWEKPEQRSEHDHGKSQARCKQDQSVGTDTPATATTKPEYRQESGQQEFLGKSDL